MTHRLNRRDFSSAAIASSIGYTTAALSFPDALAASNRTWRVAVIGHTGRGDYGHGLEKMWRLIPGTEVVAVADGAGLDAAARRMPQAKAFADYGTMLREIQPEIVAIAPRHVDQHHAMCLASIAAGARGIYIEKPFCRTPEEADQIVKACQEHHVALAVAHRNRYHPVLPVIKRLVTEGAIGQLLEIRSRGKEDHRGGAQDLWVLGSHLLNLGCYFAGAPTACSGMLYQDGRPCTQAEVRPGDEGVGPIAGNEVHARFETHEGIPLFFDSIQNHGDRAAGFGMQLIGTGGVFDFRVDSEPLVHFREGNPHHPTSDTKPWLPVSTAGIDQAEPIDGLAARVASHQSAGEDLIESIQQDRAPLCDVIAGWQTVEMICAVFASHRQGGARVELPLAQRQHPLAA